MRNLYHYHTMEGQLRDYFRAKRLQDKKINDQAKKIVFDDSLSQEQKDARIKKLRAPCKKCKGGASLVFERKGQELSISCTSGNPKCNKQISRGAFAPIGNIKEQARQRIAKLKTGIVQLRLEQLHNLVDTDAAVQAFDAASAELAKEEANLERLSNIYAEKTQMAERTRKAQELDMQLQSDVMAVRQDLRTWKSTNQKSALDAAAQRYGDVVEPIAKELRETKYEEAFTATIAGSVVVVERPTTIQQTQVSLST